MLHVTKARHEVAVSLSGGINKVTVTGGSTATLVDRLRVTPTEGTLKTRTYEAQDAKLAGSAALTSLPLATDGTAITGIGGDPGNGNTATFTVAADKAGQYALRIRYSNPEQSPATHYNPDPLARHADISINGGQTQRVSFPHTFHQDNFWELTVPVHLKKGQNTITFRSEELPNFDGTTYASDTFPGVLLRSRYAPLIDRIVVAPYAREIGSGREPVSSMPLLKATAAMRRRGDLVPPATPLALQRRLQHPRTPRPAHPARPTAHPVPQRTYRRLPRRDRSDNQTHLSNPVTSRVQPQ